MKQKRIHDFHNPQLKQQEVNDDMAPITCENDVKTCKILIVFVKIEISPKSFLWKIT